MALSVCNFQPRSSRVYRLWLPLVSRAARSAFNQARVGEVADLHDPEFHRDGGGSAFRFWSLTRCGSQRKKYTTWRLAKLLKLNADTLAYPAAFSKAPAGDYQIMALLDVNHSFPYSNMGPGDLRSVVVATPGLKPAESRTGVAGFVQTHWRINIRSTRSLLKLITFQSPALTAFWAGPSLYVPESSLPPSLYNFQPTPRYPVVYKIHGFGGSHLTAWKSAPGLL